MSRAARQMAAPQPAPRPPGTRRPQSTFWLLALSIFTLALALRLFYLWHLRHLPLFDHPIMDAQYHDEWAQRIAAGTPGAREAFFRAPLYPYILGAFYALCGHSHVGARVFQFVIGALSCVLIFALGRRVFDATVGLAAALMAALYGVFIYFEGELLIPVLVVFLDLLLVRQILICAAGPRAGRGFLAGALLGLSALARPNVLLVGVALGAWLFLHLRRREPRAARRCLLAYAGGALLTIAPVTARNLIVGGDAVLISSQAGVNFYIGNNPRADGILAAIPEIGADWQSTYEGAAVFAEQTTGRDLRASEVSRFWMERALRFARTQPLDFARLMLRKFLAFWTAQELPNNTNLYFFARESPLLRLLLWHRVVWFPFGVVGPLALLGLWLSRRSHRSATPPALFIGAYALSIIPFFVNSRFRVPVLPFLILFAAYAAVWIVRRVRARRWAELPLPGAALLLAALAMNAWTYGTPAADAASSHNKVGIAYLAQGRPADAIAQFERALESGPQDAFARINLGSTLLTRGEHERAVAVLEAGLPYGNARDRLHYSLALAWTDLGNRERAITHYAAAIAENPAYLEARNNLGSLYAQKGDLAAAAEQFRQAAALAPQSYRPRYNLGVIHSSAGRLADAAAELQACLRLKPDHADAYFQLGWVREQQGQFAEARAAWDEFLRLAPATDPRRSQVETSSASPERGRASPPAARPASGP